MLFVDREDSGLSVLTARGSRAGPLRWSNNIFRRVMLVFLTSLGPIGVG